MSQTKASKVDTIVMVVAVFFACLLSFSAGTFIGKRFSDYQYQISQLKGQQTSSSQANGKPVELESPTASIKNSEESMMSDDEVALLAAEFEKSANQAESVPLETLTAESMATETKPEVSVSNETIGATKTANNKVVSLVAEEPQRQVASANSLPKNKVSQAIANQIKDVQSPKFTVQVGAYPSEKEATLRANELKSKGLGAFVVQAHIADKQNPEQVKIVHRVGIGIHNSSNEAEAVKKDLMAQKVISSAFVQRLD